MCVVVRVLRKEHVSFWSRSILIHFVCQRGFSVSIPYPRMIRKVGQHKINGKSTPLAGLPELVPKVILFV